METARDALDRAVQQLFVRPARQRFERATPSRTRPSPRYTPLNAAQAAAHPLCECLVLQPLADDWQHLRRFPVLKRYVLAQWRSHCEQFNRGQKQRQRLQHNALATPASSLSAAYARRRAIVVHSVHALCITLYQCGLLHVREVEFVRLLVAQTLEYGLGDALLVRSRRTVGSSVERQALPLRVRMLLLHAVLEHMANLLASSAADSESTIAARRLVEDVCTSLHEDVLEAIATSRTTTATTGTSEGTRATPQGAQTPQRPVVSGVCAFCQSSMHSTAGTSARTARAETSNVWREVTTLVQTTQRTLDSIAGDRDERRVSTRTQQQPDESTTARALAALRTLLSRPDVTSRLASRNSQQTHARPWQRHLQLLDEQQQQQHDPRDDRRERVLAWHVSRVEYEHICERATAATQTHSTGSMPTPSTLGLWERVWRHALQQHRRATSVAVSDVIVQCARADVFALVPSRNSVATQTCDLPGYRVVCDVLRARQIGCFCMIALFERAMREVAPLGPRASSLQVVASASASSVVTVCRAYLTQLLSECERPSAPWHRSFVFTASRTTVTATATATALSTDTGAHLAELAHALFTMFEAAPSLETALATRRLHSRHWDQLLHYYATTQSTYPDPSGVSHMDALIGLQWLNALVLCSTAVQDAETSSLRSCHGDSAFQSAFGRYVQRKVASIVAGNGRSIASDDSAVAEVLIAPGETVDAVRDAVAAIARVFSVDWLSELTVALLQQQQQLDRRAWSVSVRLEHQRGMAQLFFPALASAVVESARHASPLAHDTDDSSSSDASGEHQFVDVLQRVAERVRTLHGTHAAVTTLLRFCTDWDAFASTDATTRDRDWGRRGFAQLHLLSDTLRTYESERVIDCERDDVLMCLRDVLQSTTSCPPALEERLFRLLTAIKRRLERSLDGVAVTESSDLQVTGLSRDDPASHTNDTVARLIQQLCAGSIQDVRAAVETSTPDAKAAMRELVRHTERWIDLMEAQDARVRALGKETKLRFALVCSRLLCWLSDTTVHAIREAATPVSADLVDLITTFVASHARADNSADSDLDDDDAVAMPTTAASSSVRVELAIRAFVHASVVPDLCELTDVVMHAIIGCNTTGARDALLQLTHRIAPSLLVEVALETLRRSLSTECLPYLDRQPPDARQERDVDSGDEDDDDADDDGEAQDNGARRTDDASVNRLSNALTIVGLSAALFGRGDITWSVSLFDEQALQHWLLCFFDVMVFASASRALVPIDELLSSLEVLLHSHTGERMTAHSYVLTALLCTAAFPQSRVARERWSNMDKSVFETAQQLLTALAVPKTLPTTTCSSSIDEDEASAVLVVDVDRLAVTRACVLEETLTASSSPSSSSLLLSESARTALMRRLRLNDSDASALTARYVVAPFATWLTSATIYSQTIAAALTTESDNSSSSDAWEHVFTDYVVGLYLPLEFTNCTLALVVAWIRVWICMNVDAAMKTLETPQLLLLLPFQQQLVARLSAMRPRSVVPSTLVSVSSLLFAALDASLTCIASALDAVDAAILTLDDSIAKFDLVSLFVLTERPTEALAADVVEQFARMCADERLALLTDLQAIHVLKAPLELLAFAFIRGWDVFSCEDVAASLPSTSWLERALAALKTSVKPAADARSDADDDEMVILGDGSPLSAEVTAFWYEWTQVIERKYAYVDPMRCEQFVHAATEALVVRCSAASE